VSHLATRSEARSQDVTPRGHVLGRALTAGVFGIVLAAAAVTGTASVAGAATAGAEVIVSPGTTKALASGASSTPYGVVLPTGAACPGDTAHDGYHVFSYLVPQGSSPTDVSFKTGEPSTGFGYISAGAYSGAVNTAESTGQVVGLPTDFVWTRLTPQDLFPTGATSATWNGGIACADTHGQVTDYWNSTIRFTADAADPHGFTWKVIDQGTVQSTPPVGLWVGIGLLVIAAGAGATALRMRRRDPGDRSGRDGPDGQTDGAPARPVGGTDPEAVRPEAVSR
jgi:hypothetical protein